MSPGPSERIATTAFDAGKDGASPPRRPSGRLFRKYILLFVLLVGGALLASGALQLWFSYEDSKAALARVQKEKALSAAARIEAFINEITRQIGWTARAQWARSVLEQRRIEYLQLLREASAITEVSHLDASGHEELMVSRLAMDVIGSGKDYSHVAKFIEAKAHGTWFSPVYFRKESEPYITVAIAGTGRDKGVTVAEVNLKFIWDVVSRIKVGKAGYAYVADPRGLLIAHPDIGLVLRKTDLMKLPQVRSALATTSRPNDEEDPVLVGRDLAGRQVLTANAIVAPTGWRVFVDLPLSEAFAPLYASLMRTGALMFLGLSLAVAAGLLLARRMVVPIAALQRGAERIGAGDLGHRIDIRTGDELETLANQFNSMAADLQSSYATLERRVEERTAELTESLDQQTASSEILRAIASTPADARRVLDIIAATARRLLRADRASITRIEDGVARRVATSGFPAQFPQVLGEKLDRGSPSGRAVIDKTTIHVEDVRAVADQFPSAPLVKWNFPARSVLSTPLMREDEAIGSITVSRSEVRPFNGKETSLLQSFANQAVIAIENARLLEELRSRQAELAQSIRELTALGEVSRAVSSTLDLRTVFDTVVRRSTELTGGDAGAIFRYTRIDGSFSLAASCGLEPDVERKLRALIVREDETAMGRAIATGAPVQVPDITGLPGFPLRELSNAAGLRAALVVPLIGPTRIIGTLVVLRRTAGAFPDSAVDLMRTFANQAVLAIQNARLFREIEDKSRQLEIASQHKSQFLANMSHELRTPLNAVLGYTEMLADGLYGELPAKSVDVLGRVQANGKHLLALINDVLDLAKIEAGQLTLSVDDYAMETVVQSVIVATESLAREKGLALTAQIAPAMPAGHGDERRLTQVLLNLVGNAIKFTDSGSVTVTAAAEDGMFHLAVRDTGPGIAPADQARIFDEFQQVDNTSTRKKGGSGLGLAISKRIVEMHRGTITVQSTPGEGSTFSVDLPVRVADAREVA